ncbi:T5orf172 multi-domain protein [Pyrenophora teres f. maculata]|nr:T5orf172 multi-domain protein [Pyrenophora teres f. maculata]
MFTGRTPESLIPRSDSRNPATTCKGITKSGRPCRRPIDAKASNDGGVIAVVSVVNDDSDDEEIGAAAYFCWQHKGQAEQLAAQTSSGPATQLYPLKERNSIDTLVERLGVLDVNEPGEEKEEAGARAKKKKERRASASSRPPRRVNRPPTWDTVQGPLISRNPANSNTNIITPPLHPPPPPPNLASTLLAELSKPISPHDDAGYIYIFWLTPSAAGPAPGSTASSLLAAPSGPGTRRTSDVMRQFSVKGDKQGEEKEDGGDKDPTILLKIGRANNVHRRMNEWSRQCGYSLSLVRYYPYISSSSPSTTTPRKVPHASRVERLIHLELAAHRVVQQCGACGKMHREWFRVGASREGVAGVDEVVRRWVGWDEGGGG